jgi:hypothetical protein
MELFEQGDLANGGGGDALIFVVEADVLDGNNFVGKFVSCFVDDAVGTFPDLIDFMVLVGIELELHCWVTDR